MAKLAKQFYARYDLRSNTYVLTIDGQELDFLTTSVDPHSEPVDDNDQMQYVNVQIPVKGRVSIDTR